MKLGFMKHSILHEMVPRANLKLQFHIKKEFEMVFLIGIGFDKYKKIC